MSQCPYERRRQNSYLVSVAGQGAPRNVLLRLLGIYSFQTEKQFVLRQEPKRKISGTQN